MEGLRWDSRPDDESKAALELGKNFHLLAQRYFLGIDIGLYDDSVNYAVLKKWMHSLMGFFEIIHDAAWFPECTLRTNSHGLQIESNFDLIAVENGHLTVWDWKTHGFDVHENREKYIKKLENSFQTIVYLYTLGEQAAAITGKAVELENLSMKYWQPDPLHITVIKYDATIHGKFRSSLQNMVSAIKKYDFGSFDKAKYVRNCRQCEFNWFCNRW